MVLISSKALKDLLTRVSRFCLRFFLPAVACRHALVEKEAAAAAAAARDGC
jgi:hypothetical protein